MTESNRIGMIGLGLLGSALAGRLIDGDYKVTGFDLDPLRRREFHERGGTDVENAREVASDSERIILSLPSSPAVESVIADMMPAIHAGQIIIDTTTGDPHRVEVLGRQLAEQGVTYVDATILGSSEQVRSGDAIIMAGSAIEPGPTCGDLFNCIAARWFHVGAVGAGSRMKLVVNLVLGLNRAVLAEGLTFARAMGIDGAQALAILQSGASYSRVMDVKGAKMLAGDFTPQARLSQHLKDVDLILDAGSRIGAALPLSRLHRELLTRVCDEGNGDDDNSAIIRAFETRSTQ